MPTNSGPVMPCAAPVIAQRLADRQDMRLVEGVVERGAAMPRGAERHPLRRNRRVGLAREIGRHQPRDVRQHRRIDDLAGERIDFGGHWVPLGYSELHCRRHCSPSFDDPNNRSAVIPEERPLPAVSKRCAASRSRHLDASIRCASARLLGMTAQVARLLLHRSPSSAPPSRIPAKTRRAIRTVRAASADCPRSRRRLLAMLPAKVRCFSVMASSVARVSVDADVGIVGEFSRGVGQRRVLQVHHIALLEIGESPVDHDVLAFGLAAH